MYSRILLTLALCIGLVWSSNAQSDIDDLLDAQEVVKTRLVTGAFKATRVINLHSIEKKAPGALELRISHRFGPVNGGAYQLWGLDQATMRMGLDYGINDYLMVGVGRSTYQKTYDAFMKLSLLRQSTGRKSMPVSVLYYSAISGSTLKWAEPDRKNYFTSRLSYVHQLIIGSKLTESFSWQLSPTLVHRNFVETKLDQNMTYAAGVAGRYKLSRRTAINVEYIYRIPPSQQTASFTNYYNSLSIGLDIETGGHVFQLHVSNSLPMFEKGVIMETNQSWKDAGIHFGFNITRDFLLK